MWWPFKKKPTIKIGKKEESENMAVVQTTEAQIKSLKAKIKDLEQDNLNVQTLIRNHEDRLTTLIQAIEQLRSMIPNAGTGQGTGRQSK